MSSTDIMSDICDGEFCKSFTDNIGLPFFSDKRNIAFMLKLNLFNQFKNSQYSLGIIYMVILNLPRDKRFLWENVLVLGIIPGAKEPKKNINSFLKPIVDELLVCWSGITLIEKDGLPATYKFALVCISSDIPATRKCGGFLSKKGCSKCNTSFTIMGDRDLGGFKEETWKSRNGEEHKNLGMELLSCNTLEEVKHKESASGVRYSELFRLPYFDPIKMHVVDPMHNLFLGVAKNTFCTWIETETLNDSQLNTLDERQQHLRMPSDLGTIAAYKCIKADEWKHFTLIYSMYCLRGILPDRDLNIWSLFVNGCFLLCKPSITMREVNEAHLLLKMFCTQFEQRYGSRYTVPNMHMMLHLKDFGPVYAFWCFRFERYNGILGSYKTNSHATTVQIMRKFVTGCKLGDFEIVEKEKKTEFLVLTKLVDIQCSRLLAKDDLLFNCEKAHSVCRQTAFDSSTLFEIRKMLETTSNMAIKRICAVGKIATRLKVGNQIIAVNSYRGNSPYSYVIAKWFGQTVETSSFRPAIVRGLYEIRIATSGDNIPDNNHSFHAFWIAKLDWFKQHQKYNYYGFNCPTKIWDTEFERFSDNIFIPARLIKNRFICVKESIKYKNNVNQNVTDSVTVVIPLPLKSMM